ncbi:calcium channel protein CCH1 [Rhodotorula paludigena]|uniref:calcium channel protein CCH1 n=1 Tax=Rhodotorula paludigena TaxID=86838 RepID=UPI00318205C2
MSASQGRASPDPDDPRPASPAEAARANAPAAHPLRLSLPSSGSSVLSAATTTLQGTAHGEQSAADEATTPVTALFESALHGGRAGAYGSDDEYESAEGYERVWDDDDRGAADLRADTALGTGVDSVNEAVPGSRQPGDRPQGWRHFRAATPSNSTDVYAPSRSSTIGLRDGSTVRTLPAVPPASSSTPSTPLAHEDDPFRASTGSSQPSSSSLFDPHYGVLHTRADSHPLSLAPSSTDPSYGFSSHPTDDPAGEEDELRSPLQSHTSSATRPPPQRRARVAPSSPPAHPAASHSRTSHFLHSLAASPVAAAARLSSRSRSRSRSRSPGGRGAAGWHALEEVPSAGGASTSSGGSAALKRRSTLTVATERLRRMSVRVVNVAGADAEELNEVDLEEEEKAGKARQEDEPRTPTGAAEEEGRPIGAGEKSAGGEGGEKWKKRYEEHEKLYRQLRGNTLGWFGPDHRLRQACAKVLTARWTEPIILLLIILQVVVQTIQASPDVYAHPRPTKGYFHTWEDVVLFVVFCIFTVEIVARVIVTGLIINPPRPPSAPEPKTDIYGTPKRSPSLLTKISTRLSPLPSPQASPSAHRPGLFPSPSQGSLARTHSASSHLSPIPPSPTKGPSSYPPASTDITTMDYASFPGGASSTASLIREDSVRTATSINPGPLGVGLGFTAPSASAYEPHSIKAGLASVFPAATAPASANSGASTHTSPTFGFKVSSATTPYALSIKRQRQTYQQAFLRHSWNRIDFIAVVCFWVAFALSETGLEASDNLWFFRALSVLRATRLLAITAGTQTILHSLKRASPLLVKVGLFVAFGMILFSIIGVQAFRGSYERACVWVDPAGILADVVSEQPCGGFVDRVTGETLAYLNSAGQLVNDNPKGFICAAPSVCRDSGNPAGGNMSFDNIFAALMQVVIIASANTWTDNMYHMMDTDFFVSVLYFIFALIILNYWTLNLLVAVITSTFADIRLETKHSAFANTSAAVTSSRYDDDRKPRRALGRTANVVGKVYQKTHLVWVALIVASIAFMADREYNMDPNKSRTYEWIELGLTLAFDVEIAIRMFASLPEWRSYFLGTRNRVDLFLAIMTSLIQIPPIFHSDAYAWLTVFQIARFYRVILALPRMRRLLHRVLGTFVGLLNMTVFLLLMTFITALIGVQFLRGIPGEDDGVMTYFQIYNAFLVQYQLLSSENWTDPLAVALAAQRGTWQIALTAIFMCGWMIFAYFILLNLFIALLNENWQLEEADKRARQLEAFVQGPDKQPAAGWFKRFDPYTFVTTRMQRAASKRQQQKEVPLRQDSVESASSGDGIIDRAMATSPETVDRTMTASPETLDRRVMSSPEPLDSPGEDEKTPSGTPASTTGGTLPRMGRRIPTRLRTGFDSLRGYVAPSSPLDPPTAYYHSRTGTSISQDVTFDEQVRLQDVKQKRQNTIAEYIVENPVYDKSLFLFPQSSRIRRFCQALVDPAYGPERINGREPIPVYKWAFAALMLVIIVSSVAVAGVANPHYRREYFLEHGNERMTWYNTAEVALGLVFILEFIIKVVADGFIYAPNAYLLSIWNCIDFFVLATVITNVILVLIDGAYNSRFTRALKAFRALRIINLWPAMRQTFYDVLILGFGRILDASILAVLYIIPFAVWGQNIFSGMLYYCTDDSVRTKAQCVGEYLHAATDDWSYMAPRVWKNPSVWSFDSFRSSLLILFEIISLEGWIDVLESAMQITGLDRQPEQNASQWSGLFFVLYNLVGATFVLTVFVSVIIASFTRRTGNSLLTTEQRQWQDLRSFLSQQRPFKRPRHRPTSPVRAWCFDRAIHKHGWWSRGVTSLYVINTIVLASQATATEHAADAYNYIFLGFTLLYLIDVVVRLAGLGTSFFENGWNIYDLVVIAGTVATTVPILLHFTGDALVQLQKVFLVALIFKLVQRNDELHQLFKTAVSSLPALLNIFALWLCLFLVYAIFYLEMFGLTRWESAGTRLANYYTFWSTMVLLALQSTGEGWNQFMHDYTVEWPYCTASSAYLFSDCGSSGWAYVLFITWNVLSMYLFVNLILGVIVEAFGFAYKAYGNVTRVTREQMRGFKQVWAEFDPERTGYLQPRDVSRFCRRLSGVFEVKIYRDEWSVQSLRAGSYREAIDYQTRSPAFHHYLTPRGAYSLERVDLDKLRHLVGGIDQREVAARRDNWNRLYHEAMHDAELSLKGISFTKMLRLIAHYRLIDDDSALQMDELAARRRKQQVVSVRVDTDRVNSFLRMVVLRRRFLDHLERKRVQGDNASVQSGLGIPAINVTEEYAAEDADRNSTPSITVPHRPSVSFAE